MWFKGALTSEKLGTLIDSELLIYCLQADYILSRIWVCISKTLSSLEFTPLLLLGFGTGNLQVGNSEPVPIPVNTIPVAGTGTHRTC
jgi:hypothetical protein